MKLSICIPVFNNYNLTKSCLQDLSFLPNDVEVIVCDNASTDDTINLLDLPKNQLPVNFKYIRNEDNLGFAKGSNLAYQRAVGKYIIFLNNDIRIKKNKTNWPLELIKHAENNYIVGPTIGRLDGCFNFISEYNHLEENTHLLQTTQKYKEYFGDGIFYLSGWCICAKKEIFDKLIINNYCGPFSEEFWTYFEDSDLSIRANLLGIDIATIYIPIQHLGKMTSKKIGLATLYISAREKFIKKWTNKI